MKYKGNLVSIQIDEAIMPINERNLFRLPETLKKFNVEQKVLDVANEVSKIIYNFRSSEIAENEYWDFSGMGFWNTVLRGLACRIENINVVETHDLNYISISNYDEFIQKYDDYIKSNLAS